MTIDDAFPTPTPWPGHDAFGSMNTNANTNIDDDDINSMIDGLELFYKGNYFEDNICTSTVVAENKSHNINLGIVSDLDLDLETSRNKIKDSIANTSTNMIISTVVDVNCKSDKIVYIKKGLSRDATSNDIAPTTIRTLTTPIATQTKPLLVSSTISDDIQTPITADAAKTKCFVTNDTADKAFAPDKIAVGASADKAHQNISAPASAASAKGHETLQSLVDNGTSKPTDLFHTTTCYSNSSSNVCINISINTSTDSQSRTEKNIDDRKIDRSNDPRMSFQTVLEQQRATIERNQQIIEAQQNELHKQKQNTQLQQKALELPQKSKTKDQAKGSFVQQIQPTEKLKHYQFAAIKQRATTVVSPMAAPLPTPVKSCIASSVISRENSSDNNSTINETCSSSSNRWKLSPAGDTEQKILGNNDCCGNGIGINNNSNTSSNENVSDRNRHNAGIPASTKTANVCNHHQHKNVVWRDANPQTVAMTNMRTSGNKHNLSMVDLEVRRERNRKHAKKSRLRKKSLTSDLEQSLEWLRNENAKFRACIEDHIARKKEQNESNEQPTNNNKKYSIEGLLEERRIRSHDRFVCCILGEANQVASNGNRKTTKTKGNRNRIKNNSTNQPSLRKMPHGRGASVNEKTLKVLRGLSKALLASRTSQQNRYQMFANQSMPLTE